MSKEIKFNVRLTVDGKEQLQTATVDVRELRDAIEASKTSAQRFTEAFIHFNQGIEVVRNLSDAFSYFSNNLRDAAQQSRDVTTLTGKTGEEMQRLRNGVQAVAEYFGKDFNEVLRSVNSLANGFGVSMDEALELVRSGLVSGADIGGDFLDTLREYPRYFKEAGLSAEDFVAITANAAKQGVFSDKGVDVIKEGNLRIREMTKATADALNGIGISADLVQQQLRDGSITTFEVMQQVAAKLKELPASSSQVGTAIADIFGGPGEDAGLEYIKTLANVKLSMDEVKTATNGVAEQQERQIKMQEQIKNAMSSIIDLSGVYADMKPYLDVASQAGFAVVGISNLVSTVKALNIASKARTFANYVLSFLACAGNARKAAVATNMMTLAARSNAAAVTSATVAVRGFMAATVVGAALAALTWAINELISSFNGVDDAAKKAADGVDDVSKSFENAKQSYDSTLKSTFGDLMSRFNGLRAQWKALATEQQKTDWIRKNADAFNDLGLKIENAADAEAIFNGNTDTIVEAFTRRAKAAAYAAELTELYGEKLKLTERKNAAQKASYETRMKQTGDNSVANKDNPYASQIQQRERNIAAIGADLRRGGDGNIADLDKQLKATDERIAYVEEQMRKNTPTTVIGKGKGGNGGVDTGNHTNNNDDKPAEKGSIAWYENRISDLHKRIENESNTDVARKYKTEIETLENELKNKKEAIGIDTDISIDRAVTNVERLQKELAEAKKSVTEDVSSKTNVERLQKEIEENKKQAYEKAGQEIERVQQNYEIGIIGKDETFKTIENINEKLKSIGVNPIKVNFKTNIELLQEKLNDAQKEFDEAITIEARVEAQTKINGIQAEIDEATKGKLTIEADVKSSYITQGSAEDKRQSYSNARQKADRIQQDYEIGLIGKDEALRSITELNLQVEQLGLKPVHIEVETEDLDRAKEKMRETSEALRNGWSGIKGIGDSIQGITDALESDANAWEKITSVVDGMIQAFMGIKAVIDLVNTLTGATTAQATAQNAQTMATTANTTATVAHTAATTADTTASALNTTTKSGEAVANATASGAKLPFPANIAAIAAGVAAVVAALAMVGSFSTGGIVGGSSPTGDKLIARVNSGEMILNKHQQMRMLKILNSSTAVSTGISQSAVSNYYGGNITLDTARLHNLGRAPEGSLGGNVHFEIDGRKLVGVLANETRVSSKSGKRTNIRI